MQRCGTTHQQSSSCLQNPTPTVSLFPAIHPSCPTPRSACSTPTLNQFFSMAVNCGTYSVSQLQVFISSRLRYILKVWWLNRISHKELWTKTKQNEISTTVKRRKWSWIGHTLRKYPTKTTKQALDYNPQGKGRQGRPKINWRRSTLQDLHKVGVTWQYTKSLAQK